ncbi:Uncharacterized MFS-type transporter C1683.03c [Serendipita indica DSM 11827]|nr:Uncharacterized MFS-type transporter C1683.03c [Serendipita indica DSM 11827]
MSTEGEPVRNSVKVKATKVDLHSNTTTVTDNDADMTAPTIPVKRSFGQSVIIVAACTGTMILNVALASGVSIAIPKTAESLHMSSSEVSWIISAFTLSSGCLLVLLGRLADLYGRKLVWMAGGLWTTVFTLACGFAQTGVQLIILRAMSGIGQAAMIPAAIGILAHSFPPSRARSVAFATFSAGAPLGASLGMVFGGVMAQYASWRGIYYFAAGIGLVVLVAGMFSIDKDNHHHGIDKRVDWIGAFLVTAGLVLLTYGLTDGPSRGWSSPLVISFLVLSILLIGVFCLWEHYLITRCSFPPLMPLDIWTRDHGRFSAMQLTGFLEWACFTSLTFWVMLYYQNYLRLSPMLAMVRVIPMAVTGVICNIVVAITVGHISGAYLLALGTVATSLAALLFAIIDTSAPYWSYGFPNAIICVFGADFVFACGTIFVAKVAHPSEQSLAGALFQTVTMLGTTFGLSVTTIAEAAGQRSEARRLGITLSPSETALEIPPLVLLKGYRIAQWTSFGLGMLGFMTVVVFLHGIGVLGARKKRDPSTEKMPVSEKGPVAANEVLDKA